MKSTVIIFCRVKLAAMANCRSIGYRQSGMVSMAKKMGFFTNTNELEKNWIDFLEKNVTARNCNEVLEIFLSLAKVQQFNF